MRNLALAEKVLGTIEAHPGLLDMTEWAAPAECGTSACISGHAMLECGYRVKWTGTEPAFFRPDGSQVHSEEWEGRDLLGLTDEEYQEGMPGELFYLEDEEAVARLRELVEAERARRAQEEGRQWVTSA